MGFFAGDDARMLLKTRIGIMIIIWADDIILIIQIRFLSASVGLDVPTDLQSKV